MTDTQKKAILINRSWVITLGIFLIVQFIFMAVDGTSWEPNIRDSNDIAGRFFRWVLQLELFTEWFTPYSYPYFNLITLVFIIVILAIAVTEIFSNVFSKK